MSIAGKHALVTGGGRGIGLGIASLLAQKGARVSIVSRSVRQVRNAFFQAQADVSDEAQVQRAFVRCREANGPIEILVNNAGIAESAPLMRTDCATWERIIGTNLTGMFLCTRDAVADMIAAGWGRIVNVASTAGLLGAPYISAYSASKHGVVGFTRSIAAELSERGITANAVCPGYTETEMMQRAVANITSRTGRTQSEARELMAAGNPEGRIATIEEVAHSVLELIEGSHNGVALVVPGNRIVPTASLES